MLFHSRIPSVSGGEGTHRTIAISLCIFNAGQEGAREQQQTSAFFSSRGESHNRSRRLSLAVHGHHAEPAQRDTDEKPHMIRPGM